MTGINRKTSDVTKEERSALLAQFKTSGLGPFEFAKEHNINRVTFRNWIWQSEKPESIGKRYSPTERKKVVEAYLKSGMSVFEFSRVWGLSHSTLHDWLGRYETCGSDGLMNRPRSAKDRRLGMKTPQAIQNEILEIKRKEPTMGFGRIRNWLYRVRGMRVSKNTVGKTIKQEGLPLALRPRKRRRSSERVRRFERARSMQLWQSDITQFTLGPASMRVYLTVFMDDHSRYIVGWRLQSKQTADLVLDAFRDAIVRFGKPEEVLTDQGRQYFAWRGKSELEKLLEKEGIKHVVSRAHHPQTLGKCERFWETVANEFWTRAKPQDLEEARIRIKHFIDHYNHQRPHQGINGMTPADRFFGVAEEVREIIEKTVSDNALRMALDELPQPPAFLIGQVGDQRIAFHGKGGGFYLTNESLKGDENGEYNTESTSVSGYAINNAGSDGVGDQSKKSSEGARGAMVTSELPSNTGEGVMGSSDGRRAWTSEACIGEDIRDMDWINNESGCSTEFKSTSDSFLATEQSGLGRDDGGLVNTAEGSNAKTGEWDDGARGNQFTS